MVQGLNMSFQERLGRRLVCHNLFVFVVTLILFAGCSRSSATLSQITVETEVTPRPARVGPVTIDFKIKDATGKSISSAQAALEANMTHPGMTPVFSEAREISPGEYRCSLELTMSGDWVVTIHITLPAGQKLERDFEIKGVRSD
jgi:hypothetical protein